MDFIKVIVENWPINPWYKEFIPLAVGIFALFISIFSLYFTSKSYRRNSRPFVWANNFANLDQNQLVVNQPQIVMFRLINSPAKIIDKTIKLLLNTNINKKILHEHSESNIVQFPDSKLIWTYNISEREFENYISELQNSISNRGEFERIIEIKYSSIDGGKNYYFKMKQRFDLSQKNWITYFTDAK
jgi:hypothetical protein